MALRASGRLMVMTRIFSTTSTLTSSDIQASLDDAVTAATIIPKHCAGFFVHRHQQPGTTLYHTTILLQVLHAFPRTCAAPPHAGGPPAGAEAAGSGKISRFAANHALTRPISSCSPFSRSTRLNSSHVKISYAVFCLKKKKTKKLKQ